MTRKTAESKLYGYRPHFDEVATTISLVEGGGIPFRIAVLAAVEEVRGIIGDIAEGDVGGRLADNKDMVEHLERRAGEIEAMTEKDVGGEPLPLDGERQKVLDALIKEGGSGSYITIGYERIYFARKVQNYLQGGLVGYDDLIEIARAEGYETFLEELGIVHTPAL